MFDFFNIENKNISECKACGKCSTDPVSTALNETFIYEIRQLTYYILKIKELDYENITIVDLIINRLASIDLGFTYTQKNIEKLLTEFKEKRNEVISFYKDLCNKKNIEYQLLQSHKPNDEDINYIKAIMVGERQSITKNTQITNDKKNLYEIMVIMAKSAAALISKLSDYEEYCIDEKYKVLEFLNSLNFLNLKEEKLTKKIINFSAVHNKLKLLLCKKYAEKYGKPRLSPVKFEQKQGKAILVSGDNLHEFDKFLNALKDKDIYIYTHDRMILALQYPYFQKFSNLVGHFQHADFNFPLDFSTFPGPILLTKNYTNKVDTIYQANFFSTDINTGKGITPVKNYDFTQIINAAKNTKGFKEDKTKYLFQIGYKLFDIFKEIDKITDNLNNNKFKKLYIVGLLNYGYIENNFFEKLYNKIGEENFIISLAYKKEAKNIYHIKSFFDFMLIYQIIERIKSNLDTKKHPLKIILTQCTNDTLTNLFILKSLKIDDIYITCCPRNTLNPSIIGCLERKFGVKQIAENPDNETRL